MVTVFLLLWYFVIVAMATVSVLPWLLHQCYHGYFVLQQTIGQQQQITMLQNEIDKLRSDNVKLYEKVRYLQSAGYSTKVSVTVLGNAL